MTCRGTPRGCPEVGHADGEGRHEACPYELRRSRPCRLRDLLATPSPLPSGGGGSPPARPVFAPPPRRAGPAPLFPPPRLPLLRSGGGGPPPAPLPQAGAGRVR